RVGEPLGVFVGVLVPDLAAQVAEGRRAVGAPQKADELADGGLEGQLLGGDGGKAFAQVETQAGARQAERAHPGAVFLPGALVEDAADEVEIRLHWPLRSSSRRAR